MEVLFDLAPILSVPAVIKVIDAYRQAVVRQDWRSLGYTVGAWVLGTAMMALLAQSTAAELPSMNIADLILYGIGLGSTASVVHDVTSNRKDENGHEVLIPSIVVNTAEGTVSTGDAPAE